MKSPLTNTELVRKRRVKIKRLTWKKVQSGKVNSWQRGSIYDSYYALVQVYRDDGFNPPWRTTLSIDGKFVEDVLSKNKSEAMRFAQAYRKKH